MSTKDKFKISFTFFLFLISHYTDKEVACRLHLMSVKLRLNFAAAFY